MARQRVHASFDAEKWDFHEMTGTDHGIDCTLELIEEGEWHNHKIEGQIKGTKTPYILQNGSFSFPLETKTIRYGLSSSNAFVLFYVDVNGNDVYYLPLQDYFIANPQLFDKLMTNQDKISVHIPQDNVVSKDDMELQEIAKSIYVDGPGRQLHKYISEEI